MGMNKNRMTHKQRFNNTIYQVKDSFRNIIIWDTKYGIFCNPSNNRKTNGRDIIKDQLFHDWIESKANVVGWLLQGIGTPPENGMIPLGGIILRRWSSWWPRRLLLKSKQSNMLLWWTPVCTKLVIEESNIQVGRYGGILQKNARNKSYYSVEQKVGI